MEKENRRELNVDIPGSITKLQAMLKEFRLKKILYKMFFRGKGLEFETYRDFTPDDDAERIDWKATARAQKLLVKQYKEERDLKIMFIIDVGANMVFGSTDKLKCEFVTELVASFSKIILNENDKIGLILFSDSIKDFLDYKNGEKHFQLFTSTLSNGLNYGGVSDLDKALDFSMDYLDNSTSSVILVSDFLKITDKTEKKINSLSDRFETIAIRVRDPLDITLPDIENEIIIESPDSNQQLIINPNVAKKTYEIYASEQGKLVQDIFRKAGVDFLDLATDKSFVIPLAIFLKERLEGKGG